MSAADRVSVAGPAGVRSPEGSAFGQQQEAHGATPENVHPSTSIPKSLAPFTGTWTPDNLSL